MAKIVSRSSTRTRKNSVEYLPLSPTLSQKAGPNSRERVMNIIDQLEKEQFRSDVPEFKAGDTVLVQVKVIEGTRERLQAFEGLVIAKRNRGLNSAFTVRKISHGEGVERVFQTHSPAVASITVKRRGDVRKAKLYHLRELSGKAARIREKLTKATEEESAQ